MEPRRSISQEGRERVHLAVARFLGRTARWVRPGAAVDGRDPPVADTHAALLRELGLLVGHHSATGYASLEHEPHFWKLLDRLHGWHVRGIDPEEG